MLIFSLHILLAVGCAMTLRGAAENGRRKALYGLNQRLSMAIGAKQDAREAQLKLLIEEVENKTK
ncbi:MAG: hypothetical protein H0V34_09295 [Gammaproteobacteria bacterium]|nr:hypothetical protein [Gammaproteobacteria bacterium]MBA3732212.1 hypothetical protein [Gammaproteobacteria bacterium]